METDEALNGLLMQAHPEAMYGVAREMRQRMTRAEELLWSRLSNRAQPGAHYRRQQIIDRFVVDFYCHKARVAIEVDGEIHDNQRERDAERDAQLAGYV